MKKNTARVSSLVLTAALLFLTACGGTTENKNGMSQTNGQETEQTTANQETETEESADRYAPEWTKDAVIYEVNVRQYTQEGTFLAFADHLQELKDMGITTLWFMPIYPISETKRSGVLGSYYSITDYCDVNPEFGTKEDFEQLVTQAHDMGFHVMLDWVANHTGWDSTWITEHPDWYTQDEKGNIISPAGMGWPDVADLNYENQDMRTEMISCMKYWVETYDIDGYRCDYAAGVPVDFWEEARTELEKIKPFYMLAEDNSNEELLNQAFELNYNWDLYDAMIDVAKDTKNAKSLKYYIPEDLPNGAYTLNFMDNHDKNSYENTIMSAFGEAAIPAMFSLIYTIPGAPLVYTGDEIGLDHNIAFTEKDPVNWEGSAVSYRDLLARLGAVRSENPALFTGNYGGEIQYYEIENKNILAFFREKDGNVIKGIFNLSKREQTVDVTDVVDQSETVLVHGTGAEYALDAYPVSEDSLDGEVTLQPWEFFIMSEGE